MKAKDIENEMRRIAEEGRELQEKLAIIESLKDCHDNGYDWHVIESDMNFNGCNHITLQCRKSGACVIVGNKHHTHEVDGKWRWYEGPFEGMTVEEVYEVEDTDPLPEPEHPYSVPLMREKEPTGAYTMKTEPDGKGGYRTKMVPTGSEGDDNKHGENED